jgi:curved DNA-binding protein CbpA
MAETPASYVDNLRQFAERVFPTLADRSYYQILNVAPTADAPAVRSAFYKLAGQLHPDRFNALGDGEVKQRLETIYARICEAYRVLGSPERRTAYDQALAAGNKRLDMSERDSGVPKDPADSLKHPEAKKFYKLAMVSFGRRDWKGAVMNFNFARNFEPAAAAINEKLAEAQAAMKAATAAAPKAATTPAGKPSPK